MENFATHALELLAFAALSLIVVLRHNWLQKSSKNIGQSHSDAPKLWSFEPVPKRDTNLRNGVHDPPLRPRPHRSRDGAERWAKPTAG